MSFSSDVKKWAELSKKQQKQVFTGVAQHVHKSIQVGSPVTGAPGQPVDTGNLRNSWQLDFPEKDTAEISTKVVYAIPVEDGVGNNGQPVKYGKSGVGGSHSVKLTVAGFKRIVENEVREVTGGV